MRLDPTVSKMNPVYTRPTYFLNRPIDGKIILPSILRSHQCSLVLFLVNNMLRAFVIPSTSEDSETVNVLKSKMLVFR